MGPKPVHVTSQLIVRFMTRHLQLEGCWPWTSKKNKDGYGLVSNGKDWLLAHRVSYAIHYSDPGTLLVCHTCDVRHCVNPGHLFKGTQLDNVIDMKLKGRRLDQPLTVIDVRIIRYRYDNGESNISIALDFQISEETVRRIGHRLIWKHVA